MKKLILGLLVAVTCGINANAQMLWKVTGKNSKSDSYILGTHHLAPLSMLDSINGFNDALKSVDAVAGEVAMEQLTAKAQSLMGYMLAPADSLLTTVLTPAAQDSLIMVLTKFMGPQITAAQLAPLKPAAVATQLAMLESMATLSPEQAQALAQGKQLDSEVQARATALEKPVIAFETAEEQMGILMGATITEQASQLMAAVKECLTGESAINARKLIDAYMAQDLDAVATLIFEADDMNEAELKRLIYDRNHAWTTKLTDEVLPDRSVLVAVGAGHLPGKEGLLELLREAGYTVEPVK